MATFQRPRTERPRTAVQPNLARPAFRVVDGIEMLSISAKFGKRTRTWGPFMQTFEQGKKDAEHLIVHWLRNQKGYTGECWRYGVCELTSGTTGQRVVLSPPPYLEVVEPQDSATRVSADSHEAANQ